MKKGKNIQSKHIQICLDIPLQTKSCQLAETASSSTIGPKSTNQQNNNAIPNNNTQNNTVRDVIRLGSKKKWLQKQQKQNKQQQLKQLQKPLQKPQKPSLQTRLKPQRKASLIKYLPKHPINSSSSQQKLPPSSSTTQSKSLLSQTIKQLKTTIQIPQKQHRNIHKYKNLLQKMTRVSRQNPRNISTNKTSKNKYKSPHQSQKKYPQPPTLNKNHKLQHKIQSNLTKIKQIKFIAEYLTDLQIQGILNQLFINNIPEIKWPLIVVDKVYQFIRKKQWNDSKDQIIRTF